MHNEPVDNSIRGNRMSRYVRVLMSTAGREGIAGKSFILLAGRIGVLLLLYVGLERVLMSICHLPQSSYEQPVLFIELGKRLGWLVTFSFVLLTVVVARYRPLFRSWTTFEYGQSLRHFIGLITVVLAWSFSTYDYNLFFNQGHDLDRLVLLAWVPLVYWRPVFTLPFLLTLLPIIWQFDYPLGAYLWAVDIFPVRILILFAASFCVRVLTKSRQTTDFIFVTCCLTASNYWWHGLGKIDLNWLSHGHLYYTLLGAYAHGWLAFVEPASIVSLAQIISWFDWPMMGFTLLLECGALFCLWRRTTMLALLVGWIVLHLGVFALMGYCFWKWIVVDASLVVLLYTMRQNPAIPIFTTGHFILSIVLISGTAIWFTPMSRLAWYDTRLTYTYRFEAVGASGKRYTVPTSFFTPYADRFTMGLFGDLTAQPQLVGPYGVTKNRSIANRLLHASTPDQVKALEAEMGKTRFDGHKAAVFDAFIERFVGNFNRRRSQHTVLSRLHPPPLLWNFARGDAFQGQEPIHQVDVLRVTSLYDDVHHRDIRTENLRQIDIPLPPKTTP